MMNLITLGLFALLCKWNITLRKRFKYKLCDHFEADFILVVSLGLILNPYCHLNDHFLIDKNENILPLKLQNLSLDSATEDLYKVNIYQHIHVCISDI